MDDFYFLQISQGANIKELPIFFKPIKYTPFRPVSQQLFFFPMQKIFGLNPFAFHLVIFLFHCANSWLVYKIGEYFLKNKTKAKFLSLMYIVSPLHFVSLYSITGSYFLFGLFYFLLTFLLWLKFEITKKNKFYFLSLFFFVLAVFSSEITAIFPLLILTIFGFKKRLKIFTPYFLTVFLNLLINIFLAGAPKVSAFQMKLTAFPSLLRWYLLRAFGLPEGVKNGYSWEKTIIYLLFGALLIITIAGLIKILSRRGLYKISEKNTSEVKSSDTSEVNRRKTILKYLIWILIGGLPFYFMPYHLNSMYIGISFLGFMLLLGKLFKRRLFLCFSLLYILLSFFSVRLLAHTHWTVRRSQLAKYWIKRTLYEQPKDSLKETITITLPDKLTKEELGITLQDNRAFQLFYNKNELETVYQIK